jgi:hypothetical protein
MLRRRSILIPLEMLTPEGRALREELAKRPRPPTPPPARELLAKGLMPYSGEPPDDEMMTPAHQLYLIERFPGLYRHAGDAPTSQARPFARDTFACGDGWFDIIERLSAKLALDPHLIVSQLKEKMGVLRVYLHSQDGAPAPDPELDAQLDAEVDAARDESQRTCELCGQPGTYGARGGHLCVRCTLCERRPR